MIEASLFRKHAEPSLKRKKHHRLATGDPKRPAVQNIWTAGVRPLLP
jgi:hypothetical protein